MKSILIVAEQFTIGGLETHICGEVLRLSAAGVEVSLATGKAFDSTLLPDGFSAFVNDIPLDPTATSEELLIAINKLREIIRERSIDGIHIHPFTSIIPAVIAAELESIPYAITLHGPASLAGYGEIYDLLVKDFILPGSRLIVAVSPEIKKLLSIYATSESVALIPNAVSFAESTEKDPNFFDQDPRWLIISRLDQFKVQGVIDFCRKAKSVGIPGVLIVGDGPAKNDLTQRLDDLGLTSYANLIGASNQVHSLIQKHSGVAGMGRVVLEGVASRKPVVLVGYDGVKGVCDKTFLALAAEENFSGRGLPTIDSGEFSKQLQSRTADLNVLETYELAKIKFNDADAWSLFFERLSSVSQPKPSVLTGLYQAILGNPIRGSTPYLYSSELLDRLESVVCGKSYYDPRLAVAVMFCRQRLESVRLNQVIFDRDAQIVSLNQLVSDHDRKIVTLTEELAERKRQIDNVNQAMADCNGQVINLNQAVAERDSQIASLNQAMADRGGQILGLNQAVADRDGQIASLNQAVADRGRQIVSLNLAVTDRDGQIASLNQAVTDRDGQIVSLNQAVTDRDGQIGSLNQAATDRDGQIVSLNQAVTDRDGQIVNFNQALMLAEARSHDLMASTSWRITKPIRLIKKSMLLLRREDALYSLLKSTYWRLPERLRIFLNKPRHQFVAKRLRNREKEFDKKNENDSIDSSLRFPWLDLSDKAKSIAVIPCGFEFDELVNQRPINAAKHYSARGFLVLYVAWQWSPEERLSKGGEVFPGVIQIPLYDFLKGYEAISLQGKVGHYVLTMPAPQFMETVDKWRSKGGVFIYDIMDEWEEFCRVGQAPWYDKSFEKELLLKADYVSAVSPGLKNKFQFFRKDIAVIGNGYTPSVLGGDKKGISGKRLNGSVVIGYFGHLTDAWFDWDLLFSMASHFENYYFEIIGYGEPEWVRKEISQFDNISLVGKVLPADLHVYVSGWALGIIPFVSSALSEAVDPIKIYEYLYFGLPVVVTGISHLKDYPQTYFSTRSTINEVIAKALSDSGSKERLEEFLRKTTWEARFDNLLQLASTKKGLFTLYEH